MHLTGDEAKAAKSRTRGRPRVAVPAPSSASTRPTQPDASASGSPAVPLAPAAAARSRHPQGRKRSRERNAAGLGERGRMQSGAASEPSQRLPPLPDLLALTLPGLRHALLNRPLDEAARIVAEGLVTTLAPAATQVWIADPTPWSQPQQRGGAQELAPRLRAYAMASAATRTAELSTSGPGASSAGTPVPRPDPLIDEVVAEKTAKRRGVRWRDSTTALPACGMMCSTR